MGDLVTTSYRLEITLRADIPTDRAAELTSDAAPDTRASALARWAAVTGSADFGVVLAEIAKDPDLEASVQVNERLSDGQEGGR